MDFSKLFFGFGLFISVSLDAAAALEAPSDLLSKEYPPANMIFVLRIKEDLRQLYCDPKIIQSRQTRNVCRMDAALLSEVRREIPLSRNSTVAGVLASIGMTNWNGGKQVRIIKKNAILQSEYPKPFGSSDQLQQFRSIRVDPADIIVICPSD